MLIHKEDSFKFVADLSNRLRKRTGGMLVGPSAAVYMAENMAVISDSTSSLAGFEGGPTSIK